MSAFKAGPVAVVGMACRFPGAANVDEYWRLLTSGHDAITEVPPSRFDIDAWHDPTPGASGRVATRYGGFLREIDQFDAPFFGVSPHEAVRMDPQQRMLLETAWEAIEDAGLGPMRLSGGSTGVFVGQLTTNYWEMLSRAGILDIYANLGTARSALSGRLSHAFDLHGPSISIDTACSSSLTAVHLAYRSLLSGECDTALVAAVNLILLPEESVTFSQANMLSPDGRCKFAAADANGYVRSEGVAALVLRPLDRAEADGDLIHAVLHGTAVTNDGRSGGTMMSPGRDGQARTLRAAYTGAGISPDDVDYIEAHGTGTAAGDPVELGGLSEVFGTPTRTQPLLVGSAKTNIGHTEAAAGMAGLIKAVLCVRHRFIPASLHSAELTTAVDWGRSPLRVQQEAGAWPGDDERVAFAGVNSFGISGTNAHVIVGEYRPHPAATDPAAPERPNLLVISAASPEALRDLAGAYADLLASGRASLADVCHSAATRRRHQDSRLTVVADTASEAAVALRAFAGGAEDAAVEVADDVSDTAMRTVFVFPGQGSQWASMGLELYGTSPPFRDELNACAAAIQAETGWSVIDRLRDADGLTGIDVIQPALWAIEVALVAQWRAMGIEPDAVVGHSMGEVAAAHVAGMLDLADAAAVICRRSALLARLAGRGAMASVELSPAQVAAVLDELGSAAEVAVENGPDLTVIAGDPDDIRKAVERFDADGVFARTVNVDIASHSAGIDSVLADLAEALDGLAPGAGTVRMVSTVSADDVGGPELTAPYWSRNLRQPVRFATVVDALVAEGYTTFVEISPHPILTSAIGRCAAARAASPLVLPTLRREQPERRMVLEGLAALHRAGRPVPLVPAAADGRPVRLPAYRWQRERYWYEATASGDRPTSAGHPLLPPAAGPVHTWQGPLDLATNSYLLDHRVQGHAVLPGTAYLEIMREALCQAGLTDTDLRDVRYVRGLYLSGDAPPTVRVAIADGTVTVSSRLAADEPWLTHATATVESRAAGDAVAPDLDAARARCPKQVTAADFYRRFAATNNWLGAFKGIARLWRGTDEAVGQVTPVAGVSTAGHHLHPALLDACGQVLAATLPGTGAMAPFMLDSIERMTWHRRPDGPVWSMVTRRPDPAPDLLVGDVVLVGGDGARIAEITGLTLRFIEHDVEHDAHPDWLYTVDWRRADPVARPAGGSGYLLAFVDRQGLGADLPARWPGRVVRVRAGLNFRRLAPDFYEINPGSAEDHRSVLAELGADVCAGIVHLWTLDVAGLDPARPGGQPAATVAGLIGVVHLAQALTDQPLPGDPSLWLVTRSAQRVVDADPTDAVQAAALWGLGRSLAAEHPALRWRLVDLDPTDATTEPLVRTVAADDGETQLAIRAGQRYVARLRGGDVPTTAVSVPDRSDAYRVVLSPDSLLDGIGLVAVPRRDPGPGEVEIAVSHAGMNFRDVLMASGTYPGAPGPGLIGWECAGEIVAVGPGVRGLAPGDRVVALAANSMASRVIADARLTFPYPDRLTPAEAATLPIAFVTAYHGLVEVARLERGEQVLIHSATGAVGMAAIQVARLRGAEIYATAGTPQRRALLRMLDLKVVADSRSTAFADEILRATRGRGVDVVYSALPDHARAANLAVLAPYGRYVELAKPGPGATLPLADGVGDNTTYATIDVTDMVLRQPDRAARSMEAVLAAVGTGQLDPLPHEIHPVDQVGAAFERMAQTRHVGKLVLDLTGLSTERSPAVAPARAALPVRTAPPARLRADATYLVTGGLGDLGLQVARMLLRDGAQHLLLLGRTAPPPADTWATLSADNPWHDRVPLLAEITGAGVDVVVETVDVADIAAVGRLLRDREAAGCPPVRGVVHAAGVLGYGPAASLDSDDLAAVLRPKVGGALALHAVLHDVELDFFVLFSSASALLGSPMLGSYAAANASLDALAHFRRAHGLPATSINWGFWQNVGMAARKGRAEGRDLHPHGMRPFTPDEGLDVLRGILHDNPTQVVVLPVDWARWGRAYPDAAAVPLLRDVVGRTGGGAPAPVPAPRVAAPERPAPAPATQRPDGHAANATKPISAVPATGPADPGMFLLRCLSDVLGLSPTQLNRNRPLNRQGLDSLMAARVRTALHNEYGLVVPITLMLGGASLTELATEIEEQLRREPSAASH